MEDLQPGSITIAGQAYVCAAAGARQSIRLTEGGNLLECDVAFRVRKNLLAVAPEVGVVVEWNGGQYRVAFDPTKVRGHQTDCAWYLGCNAAYE